MTPTPTSVPVGGWTLRALAGPAPAEVAGHDIPATVPGTVHTDLLAAGLIPDPYLDENEQQVAWIGRTGWRYAATLDLQAPAEGEHVELVFQGIDTVAEVRLGGDLLGEPRNMHRTHRYDITAALRTHESGPVELVVDFAPQLMAAEEASEALGPRVHTNAHPFNAVRKMACNFGWDWGPDLVTAGIWRPVTVQRWVGARLGAVRTLATVRDGVGRLEVHAEVQRDTPAPLTLRVQCEGHEATVEVAGDETSVTLGVPDIDRWWPRGYGDQPLYTVETTLEQHGSVVATQTRRVGFRTVALDTTPDAHGTPFVLSVNDRPVLVKGANWIPDDCFPHRVDRARYATRVADATEANINLLRVWGGGLFESDDFYDVCDEEGLLVWQDALFACAAYAEEPPLRDEVVAEVTEAVTRLSPHPSLVIWNGNNENLWGYEDWGWGRELAGRSWGKGYYLDLLPRLIGALDPTRPYSPGSPWSFDERIFPNDPAHGTTHLWDVWNRLDYTAYRDSVPRFVAEFGYQGPPAWTTLTAAVHDDPLTPTSPGMANHQKAEDGDVKLSRGIAPHLDVPPVDSAEDMDTWHWAMSLQQARAVGFGLEHLRSWHPVCAGMIVWQLNDCWPVTSWAMVDSAGRRKPLWYAVRRAFAPRWATIQPRDGHLALVLGNDTDELWDARLQVTRRAFDGHERSVTMTHTEVAPRATATVPLAPALTTEVAVSDEVLVASGDGVRALWFFAEDRDLHLVDRWGSATAERTEEGYAVHLTAATLMRDVTLLVDKVADDATVDDAMVTVLPGETVTFRIRSARDVDPRRFLDPHVLRSTNQLVDLHHPESATPRQPGALTHA
ncbi:MAG: glycoside hydrolase family 2 TIM barrel-domain containing protein [Lapillicoccus sp.]